MATVSEEHFEISYDGPALDNHEMDVADLAPALFALSATLKRTQQVVDPGAPPVTLNIKATQEGSFEVAMLLVQQSADALGHLTDFLTGKTMTATVNTITILGVMWETINFIKQLGGRRIAAVEEASAGGVKVTLADGTTIEGVAKDVVEVARDLDFRNELNKFAAPLERDGIESVSFTTTRTVRASITRSDLPALEVPPMRPELLPELRREALVQPVGVEFDWRRWRVTEGAGALFVAVQDESFREKVEHGEVTLGAQDVLRVELLTQQERDSKGALKARHTIVKVKEHRPGTRRIPLDFPDADDEQD